MKMKSLRIAAAMILLGCSPAFAQIGMTTGPTPGLEATSPLGMSPGAPVAQTGIPLKANFPNAAHRLWPGELVNARLLLDTRPNGLTVPASVVQQGPQGAYAYVINADSSVAIRPIKVAQVSDGHALIDSGLAANEQVVVDGAI
jgi:multidrug efflux system membrane fusion protein